MSKNPSTATIPVDGHFQAKEAVLTVTKPKPPNRSNTSTAAAAAATTKEIQRKLSTLSQHSNASSIKNIDENSNEKNKNQSFLQNSNESRAPTAEYLSGGSDSGYPRGRWSHSAETSSLESPRSPSQLLRSPNPHRIKAAEDLYTQMTVQHTTTLAFLVDNFSDIARLHGEFSEFGRDLFDEVSVDTLVFKSSSPLMTKEKLALFDAIFVAPNYSEHKVTVMVSKYKI
uniref:Uncharacterized protein n=1 Tax=Panagrolaimus superbus TaxID=310955 RepID=A0A914Y7C2_9BILA